MTTPKEMIHRKIKLTGSDKWFDNAMNIPFEGLNIENGTLIYTSHGNWVLRTEEGEFKQIKTKQAAAWLKENKHKTGLATEEHYLTQI